MVWPCKAAVCDVYINKFKNIVNYIGPLALWYFLQKARLFYLCKIFSLCLLIVGGQRSSKHLNQASSYINFKCCLRTIADVLNDIRIIQNIPLSLIITIKRILIPTIREYQESIGFCRKHPIFTVNVLVIFKQKENTCDAVLSCLLYMTKCNSEFYLPFWKQWCLEAAKWNGQQSD